MSHEEELSEHRASLDTYTSRSFWVTISSKKPVISTSISSEFLGHLSLYHSTSYYHYETTTLEWNKPRKKISDRFFIDHFLRVVDNKLKADRLAGAFCSEAPPIPRLDVWYIQIECERCTPACNISERSPRLGNLFHKFMML